MPFASVASSYSDLMTTVFSTPIEAKAWFASAAVFLAVLQVSTAARMWGHLKGVVPLSDAVVGPVHRWSGRLAFLCTLPAAFHCIFILGFQTTDLRVTIHSVLGSFVYGVFVVKVLFVRNHSYPGWVLPVAGGTLFATLASLWLTSSLWYFTST
jgi:hypothetical protein